MPSIHRCELPHGALLEKYQSRGAYADCYVTEIARPVSQAEYVQAFYTSPLFKVERLLLAWLVSKPSTDAQASQLASGTLDSFAAWSVEERREDQLLMCDFQGRTRSWLMVDGRHCTERELRRHALVLWVRCGASARRKGRSSNTWPGFDLSLVAWFSQAVFPRAAVLREVPFDAAAARAALSPGVKPRAHAKFETLAHTVTYGTVLPHTASANSSSDW